MRLVAIRAVGHSLIPGPTSDAVVTCGMTCTNLQCRRTCLTLQLSSVAHYCITSPDDNLDFHTGTGLTGLGSTIPAGDLYTLMRDC
jgi:hypothetical protein